VTGYKGTLFTDPSRKVFEYLGFKSSVTGFIGLKPLAKTLSALKKGHKQGGIEGSTLQLGGAVVIDTEKTIRFYFASNKAGDHPDVADLVAAV